MKLTLSSVMVDDQEKALRFYTGVLGFVQKLDIPMGEARWLTVVSPEAPDGVQLLLEPISFLPARVYQRALFEAGIPATSFGVTDCQAEYERLRALGVVFRRPPTGSDPVPTALFEDTCGNLISLHQLS